MKVSLRDIAEILPGHPFRGSIQRVDSGNVCVVQAKDTNDDGEIDSTSLITTEVTGRKAPAWLQHHDILFVAKGLKTRSAIVTDLFANTVCSPQFFIIRIKKNLTNNVMPEFICWQLNQLPAQKYFKSSAEGTLQVSIRRQILESTPITVLDLVQQQSLVKLHSTSVAERKNHQHLIENRRKQLDAIACELLTESITINR